MIVKQLLSNFNQDFQAAAALEVLRAVISKSVFRYRKVPFYPTNIDNVSFYGKFIDIDIDAQ